MARQARRFMADEAIPWATNSSGSRATIASTLRRRWRRSRRHWRRPGSACAPPAGFRPLRRAGPRVRCPVRRGGHATEVAEVAVEVAAGIERQMSRAAPDLLRGRAIQARPHRDDFRFERSSPGLHSPRRSASTNFRFRRPWPCATPSPPASRRRRVRDARRNKSSSSRVLARLQGARAACALRRRSRPRQLARPPVPPPIGREERVLDSDTLRLRPELSRSSIASCA